MMHKYAVLLQGAMIAAACVEAEAPPISGEPAAASGSTGSLGSGGSGTLGAGTGGSGDATADSSPTGGTGSEAGGRGGSDADSDGASGSSGAAGSAGSESCSGERFILPCNGTRATRCVEGVVQQVECSACNKLSCSAACCGDVHPYVLDQNYSSQPDKFSNFNQSVASVDFDFGGADWQGAIGWFFHPAAGTVSAVRVQASVSGANAGAPFVTLEREGAGCEYVLDGSGNATFPGTNCWGGFSPNDVAWVAVRTKSTAAGPATLTVTSINITP